jgi:MFS family permease
VLADSPAVAVAAVAVFAVGLLAFPPVMQSYLMDAFPDSSAGGDLGAMRTVYIGIGALGPTYVGATATLASYDLAFWGLVVALLAAAGIVARAT